MCTTGIRGYSVKQGNLWPEKTDEPITKSVSHATYENVMAIKYMGIYPTGVTYENVMAKLVHPTGVLGISSTTVDGDGTRLMWLQST